MSFCGHFNFFLASFQNRIYFPLRSYLLTFDRESINNLSQIKDSIYNLSGYKAIIATQIPYKLIDDIFFVFTSGLLIILFFTGYKIVQSSKISHLEIIKWSVVFSLLMTISIPSHSSDLYGYIARGAQQSIYNHNPYINTVSEIKHFRSNPLFLNFMWPLQPTTYGPLFIYITRAIVCLSNNDFLLSMINFKLLNLTAFLLLVLCVLKRKKAEDIYLISWNPLLLIQGLWNCHNDLLCGVLIFFGLYSLQKKNVFWGIFYLVISIGIKYIALIIIPLIFLYLIKNKPEKEAFLHCVLGLCSGIVFILIFSFNYLRSFQMIDSDSLGKIFSNIGLVHKSLIDALFTIVKYFCHFQHINCDLPLVLTVLKCLIYSSFVIFYIFIAFKFMLEKKQDLIFYVVLVLCVFLSFTLAKFHSWYLLNFIVLIPLLENGLLKKILIVLSMTHIFAITFLDQSKILNFVLMTLLPSLLVYFREKFRRISVF